MRFMGRGEETSVSFFHANGPLVEASYPAQPAIIRAPSARYQQSSSFDPEFLPIEMYRLHGRFSCRGQATAKRDLLHFVFLHALTTPRPEPLKATFCQL